MKVLLTVASLDLSQGGPSENIPKLADGLSDLGVEVGILSREDRQYHAILNKGAVEVFIPSKGERRLTGYSSYISSIIKSADFDVVHDNGIWLAHNHIVCGSALSANKKLIISPRGMLNSWARRYRATKKRIAWLLYQKRDLFSAHKLIATANQERESILALLPGSDVKIIPNGWSIPDNARSNLLKRPKSGLRRVLFFSRIHPIKGVELLIEAWGRLRPQGWQLDIVGPGDDDYISSLRRNVAYHSLEADIRLLPPVYGEDNKNELVGAADAVVLPSYSENFGSVVVEAMGLCVPVITTTGTPWAEIADVDAGWHVDASVDGIQAALAEAVNLSDEERQAMGRRGRELVMRKYTWDSVAKLMLAVYEEALRS